MNYLVKTTKEAGNIANKYFSHSKVTECIMAYFITEFDFFKDVFGFLVTRNNDIKITEMKQSLEEMNQIFEGFNDCQSLYCNSWKNNVLK